MKRQIIKALAILSLILFVATLTGSAASSDPDDNWCGTIFPYWWIHHISEQNVIISNGLNEIANVMPTAAARL